MKSELIAILNTIEGTSYSQVQSIDLLLEYGFKLTQWIARSGEIQATAKEQLHKKRRQAYLNVIASLGSQEKKIGPMLIKDYINDCCAEENGLYELAERTNRAATHANDLVRTAVSALKGERYSATYAQAV